MHCQAFLLGQVGAPGCDQTGNVFIGNGVVLARLHARLAFAELGAADPDELEDPATEEALLSPGAACGVGHEDLLCPVGEYLKRYRGGVRSVGHTVFDDLANLGRKLVHRNRFDSRHVRPPFSCSSVSSGGVFAAMIDEVADLQGNHRSAARLLYCQLRVHQPVIGAAHRQGCSSDRRRRRNRSWDSAGLAAFGASVVIWELDPDTASAAAEEVNGLGITTDVRQSEAGGQRPRPYDRRGRAT